MPLQATSGAASYDAFGGGVAAVPQYIEDVFSTYLYTGNGTSLTVTNNIDLSTKGGLVWLKSRSTAGTHHTLFDSARGANNFLFTDLTDAQTTDSGQTLNTTGFTIGNNSDINTSAATYASWTFRKQPKFFDAVTYTGDGTGGSRQVAHNLGSTPGCVLIKRTDASGNWMGFHRGTGATNSAIAELSLNLTTAPVSGAAFSQSIVTSTYFVAGDIQSADGGVSANTNGATYVAYLFAHNAGGFGLTGTDNVISCGSYTGNGSTTGPEINLGYEPQWVMVKNTTTTGAAWRMFDNMRGFTTDGVDNALAANSSAAEVTYTAVAPTATGFRLTGITTDPNRNGDTYIYIAIRRGPMKVPTSGTSVFGLNARSGTGANATVTGGAGVTDLAIVKNRGSATNWLWASRLTGTGYLSSNATTAETAAGTTILQANPWDVMDGVKVGTTSTITNQTSNTFINYLFDRAPSFHDVVCYTGTGSARTINHNLGVAPEMIICKVRVSAGSWAVWHSGLTSIGYAIFFSSSAQSSQPGCWNSTLPTSSVFSVGNAGETNQSTETFVSYLFATCPGVSKVGSYTGTGTTKQVDCGFTGGSRFVLIKRTDSTGDWYVWDSARGIVAGNDPYLLLNSTAAEVTSTDYIDTYSAGFEISSTAPAAINASGGTFIFLAIA